jgi:hypothetical protein
MAEFKEMNVRNSRNFNNRKFVAKRHSMSKEVYILLWTTIWLSFIAFLCFIFHEPKFLWLFLIWPLGVL